MNLGKKQRETLRMKFGGKCAYCGCELPEKRWHADHVEPIYRQKKRISDTFALGQYVPQMTMTEIKHPELDCIANYFPACVPCNIHKGVYPLGEWRKELERITGVLQRGYPTYRHAVRFGQVAEHPGPVIFWFEKYVMVTKD